ncbi:hypothetical protein BN1708_001994 [Verticillium longisporum]|uniref:Uncharacterized protein n=1 Tax=Verticillium longisporum TaxID=100787 RepID=A0A0G4KD36_VERLO|nr:hypothetical protein BN1708_001994 [Verticillium longisporum]
MADGPYHDPWPQWLPVLPQYPVLEQHVPNPAPTHVLPFLEPQAPSLERLSAAPLHVPKDPWQPVPQWSEDFPQKPFAEQQSPNVDPLHVLPFLPQLPSVDTEPAPVVQVPNDD